MLATPFQWVIKIELPRMRLLFLNNYDMTKARQLWESGDYPGQHLWGATHLHKHGVIVDILPHERLPQFNRHWRVQRLLGLNERELIASEQQLRALIRTNCDVLYSGCLDHSLFLARLRRIGLLRKPLVTVVHHPLRPGSRELSAVLTHDRVLCLSTRVRQQILDLGHPAPEQVQHIEWGPDLDFYGPFRPYADCAPEAGPPRLVSAGKATRDYDTFVDALHGIRDCSAHIYCSGRSLPNRQILGDNITLCTSNNGDNPCGYRDILDDYRQAYAIAIPMQAVDRLAGLTSLLDAMAVGRPVLITSNDYIDIDVEREGIGFRLAAGDVRGWRDRIRYLLDHPDEAAAMGARALTLCEARYNITRFSEKLAGVLRETMH